MKYLPEILGLLSKEETFCLATILATAGQGVAAGQKAIVRPDGSIKGDSWPDAFAAALRALALEALAGGQSRSAEVEPGVPAFFDIISTAPCLLICGAGHIAMPLARFARETGFSVTVLDDRPDFANLARFPGCRAIAEAFVPALRGLPLGPSSYVVVITRGHEHDSECLAEILRKETAYVGLIGSRRRGRLVLETLGRKGISAERLGEVFTPIGVPIGAESPEEIALSIAAELVCIRRSGASPARALRPGRGKLND
ncbi:MAG: XdhC family protein [Elusimicrobiota bacterium]|nr:XdhC family protein [Elusimicrobiota bacterium]